MFKKQKEIDMRQLGMCDIRQDRNMVNLERYLGSLDK